MIWVPFAKELLLDTIKFRSAVTQTRPQSNQCKVEEIVCVIYVPRDFYEFGIPFVGRIVVKVEHHEVLRLCSCQSIYGYMRCSVVVYCEFLF